MTDSRSRNGVSHAVGGGGSPVLMMAADMGGFLSGSSPSSADSWLSAPAAGAVHRVRVPAGVSQSPSDRRQSREVGRASCYRGRSSEARRGGPAAGVLEVRGSASAFTRRRRASVLLTALPPRPIKRRRQAGVVGGATVPVPSSGRRPPLEGGEDAVCRGFRGSWAAGIGTYGTHCSMGPVVRATAFRAGVVSSLLYPEPRSRAGRPGACSDVTCEPRGSGRRPR